MYSLIFGQKTKLKRENKTTLPQVPLSMWCGILDHITWCRYHIFLFLLKIWNVFFMSVEIKVQNVISTAAASLSESSAELKCASGFLCSAGLCCLLVYLNVTCYTNKSRSPLMVSSVIPARRHAALSPHSHTAAPCQMIMVMNEEGRVPCDRRQLAINNKPSAVSEKREWFPPRRYSESDGGEWHHIKRSKRKRLEVLVTHKALQQIPGGLHLILSLVDKEADFILITVGVWLTINRRLNREYLACATDAGTDIILMVIVKTN